MDDLMREAIEASLSSPNRTRKTGAALMTRSGEVLVGANDFPPGIDDTEKRHAGEERYHWIEHAERNVLLQAARKGLATEGSVMATPWFPCSDCARAIVGAGVGALQCTEPDFDDPRWGEGFRRAKEMLLEAGVEVRFVDLDQTPSMEALAIRR